MAMFPLKRRSRALVSGRGAVDDKEVGVGIFLTDGLRALVFRAPVAGIGGRAIAEFDHDVSLPGISFHRLERAAAYDEVRTVLLERRRGRRKIFGISLLVAHRDAHDPIGFRHGHSPWQFAATAGRVAGIQWSLRGIFIPIK